MSYTSALYVLLSKPSFNEWILGEILCNLTHTTFLIGQREAVATYQKVEERNLMSITNDFDDCNRVAGEVTVPYLGCLVRVYLP